MSSFTDDVRRRLGEDAAPSYGALVQGGQRAREGVDSTFRMGRDERILLYGLMVVCVVLAVANPLLVDGCSGQGGLVGAARTLLTFPSAWSQSVVMGLGSVCIAGIALTTRGLSRVSADQRTALDGGTLGRDRGRCADGAGAGGHGGARSPHGDVAGVGAHSSSRRVRGRALGRRPARCRVRGLRSCCSCPAPSSSPARGRTGCPAHGACAGWLRLAARGRTGPGPVGPAARASSARACVPGGRNWAGGLRRVLVSVLLGCTACGGVPPSQSSQSHLRKGLV